MVPHWMPSMMVVRILDVWERPEVSVQNAGAAAGGMSGRRAPEHWCPGTAVMG